MARGTRMPKADAAPQRRRAISAATLPETATVDNTTAAPRRIFANDRTVARGCASRAVRGLFRIEVRSQFRQEPRFKTGPRVGPTCGNPVARCGRNIAPFNSGRVALIGVGVEETDPGRHKNRLPLVAYGRRFLAASSAPKSVPNARSAKRSARTTSGAADDLRWICVGCSTNRTNPPTTLGPN